MSDAQFADGSVQHLYFLPGDKGPVGVFKGTQVLLEERGFTGLEKVRASCKEFKCPKDNPRCCCRRMLYNEREFARVPSLLETLCNARGYTVIFLPKFHCELNFIEQCWGYAKRRYREYPLAAGPGQTVEDHLRANIHSALDSIPIETMRRFVALQCFTLVY